MTTANPSLAQIQAAVRQFRDERDWRQFHSPKNLSMSIAIEAAELMSISSGSPLRRPPACPGRMPPPGRPSPRSWPMC